MLTIGFTTVYYTLWDVNTFMVSKVINGEIRWFSKTTYQYLRNLSMDLEAAKEKVMGLGPNTHYDVNLGLHGEKWFFTEAEVKQPGRDYTFTFGWYKGRDIRTAGDWVTEARERFNISMQKDAIHYTESVVEAMIKDRDREDAKEWKNVAWQLDRAMRMESGGRRRVYARRRLIELGELIRRDWIERVPYYDPATANDENAPMKYKEVKHKWMPKALAKWQDEIGSKKGLWYENGKRIQLTIKQVKHKMSDSQYGTLYTINYVTLEGHLVTYRGGKNIQEPKQGQPFEVTATIKHDRGETYIQRLKIADIND